VCVKVRSDRGSAMHAWAPRAPASAGKGRHPFQVTRRRRLLVTVPVLTITLLWVNAELTNETLSGFPLSVRTEPAHHYLRRHRGPGGAPGAPQLLDSIGLSIVEVVTIPR
jgi:hypothetical protein